MSAEVITLRRKVRLPATVPPGTARTRLGPADAASIKLPFPVASPALGLSHKGGETAAYHFWRLRALNMIWDQFRGRRPKISGPVSVHLILEDRPGRRNLDNLARCVIDFIGPNGVGIIEGGHSDIVRHISLDWGKLGFTGATVVLTWATARGG